MFSFLKKKIKDAISSISRSAKEATEEPIVEEVPEELPEAHGTKEPSKEKVQKRETPTKKKEEKKEERKGEGKKEKKKQKEKSEKILDSFSDVDTILSQAPQHIDSKIKAAEKETQNAQTLIDTLEEDDHARVSEEETEGEEKKEAEQEPEKKGFFSRLAQRVTSSITTTQISEEKFEELFWNLELVLLESNVAVAVIEKIKDDLKQELLGTSMKRGSVEETIMNTLKKSISELFEEELDLIEMIREKRGNKKKSSSKDPKQEAQPFIIAFVGINGVGKTTSLAKLGKKLQDAGLKVVIAAADTFRAAAIEQLEEHATRLGIKIIKHDYGSDSAAVCYDAIAHARAKDVDVVLIDTAGRSNMNVNLMAELKKVIRVAKPDMTIFVGDAVTGNDVVEQATEFNETVGIDGIILAKADVDEKGGGAISVSYVTKKPILYLGTGQNYDDLTPFSKDVILENLGLG